MSRLTLTQKTAFGAVLMISCISGLVLWCWAAVGELTSRGIKATSYRVPQIERLADIEIHVTRASLALRHALLARDDAEYRAAVEDVRARMDLASRTMEAIDRGAVTPRGRNAVEGIRPVWTAFAEVAGRTLAMVEDRSNRDAFGYLAEHAVPARNALLERLHAERQRQFLKLDEEFSGLAKEAGSTRIVIAVLGSVLVVGMVVGAFAVVNVIRGLGTDPSDLKAVVADIANGELARKLAPREGDATSVLAGIERMRGQLSDAVGRVRRCADQVATAGAQIAGGNQDLAARTERQAMALQQTAASTEELGATVKLNAENARKAASLATSCSALAIDGGQRVREAVETMRTIEDGSRKIGDILSVIDGIAFQTNILALNAAVEAARAGQQGRGFAVVATEVRALAQRSAGAAREIRSLIVDSTGRVERGVSIVGQAGAKMDDVVDAIRRLESLVAAIAAASGEQSEGVEQVGHAVADMDRVVQQNVALVEQSTAAATSLQSQSDELVRAVSAFRLA